MVTAEPGDLTAEEASVVLCRIGQLSHLPTQTTALGLHNSEVRSTDGFLRSFGICYEFSLQSACNLPQANVQV